jgi:hypothetical protein
LFASTNNLDKDFTDREKSVIIKALNLRHQDLITKNPNLNPFCYVDKVNREFLATIDRNLRPGSLVEQFYLNNSIQCIKSFRSSTQSIIELQSALTDYRKKL